MQIKRHSGTQKHKLSQIYMPTHMTTHPTHSIFSNINYIDLLSCCSFFKWQTLFKYSDFHFSLYFLGIIQSFLKPAMHICCQHFNSQHLQLQVLQSWPSLVRIMMRETEGQEPIATTAEVSVFIIGSLVALPFVSQALASL